MFGGESIRPHRPVGHEDAEAATVGSAGGGELDDDEHGNLLGPWRASPS